VIEAAGDAAHAIDSREVNMMETESLCETNNKTILVVEDSATQALHLRGLLEQEGLQVAWARDGREGVEMAQQLQPDLIVLDLQMPEMNGFQVCQQLGESPTVAGIPVIMFTRHDDPEMVVLSMELGITDYIPKDAFADAVLLETLRQMGVIAPREA
jgi:PleD family two-component response regulator